MPLKGNRMLAGSERQSASRKGLFKEMGPAWVVSAVACGPATIASLALGGSTFGYSLLWVVILGAALASVAQYLAAKIGILGQAGIIAVVERHLGRIWGWLLTWVACLATWLAAMVLMKALAETTGLVSGLFTPAWGALYSALFLFLLILGGYKWLELACKAFVVLLLICFLGVLFFVELDPVAAGAGMLPSFPGGLQSAVIMAGIVGGGVHITIIAMHTYTVNARGWTLSQLGLARKDTLLSMLAAFGLYSMAVFLAAAAVLHPAGIRVESALDVAQSLVPLLEDRAGSIFLLGFWAAVVSTVLPTFMASAFFLSDMWSRNPVPGSRAFNWFLVPGCALSAVGPYLQGNHMFLLVLMLALGLCGTLLILVLMLVLLNRESLAGIHKNSALANLLALALFAVTAFMAGRFVYVRFLA